VLDWLLFTTALAAAIYTLLTLMGVIGTLEPATVPYILAVDATLAALLVGLVGFKLFRLVRDRSSGKAGAKLHLTIVLMLGLATALPSALVAGAAMIALDQGLKPWFSGNLKVLVENAGSIASQYQQQLCQNVVREMRLMSADVERAYSSGLYANDRTLFREFLTSRAVFLGLPNASIMKADGSVVEKANVGIEAGQFAPSSDDFTLAATDEPPCILSQETLGSLTRLKGFDGAYLVVGRPIDKKAIEFPVIAQLGVEQYQVLDSRREATTLGIGVVFVMVTLLVLLAAIVLGLSLADRIAQPIGRLIQATDEVSSGNLYVQVPVARVNDDISHLGRTFNKMTSVLRSQHDSLVEAKDLNDQRRRFMEAVLAGVPAGVIGVDTAGIIRVSNPTADTLLGSETGRLVGKGIGDLLPQVQPMIEEALAGNARLLQQTIEVSQGTRDRTISVRVAPENALALEKGLVITLDDITDLVTAQRTSAWADVARRIAHEIKNPLTPIQLSAERIRRKFGKVIAEDKHIFEQCTDTIVRQVEDIKQMVDEFSSFARTPRPVIADEDVVGTVREVVFMMRVAHPVITFKDETPEGTVAARFDRRLIAQAVQNIIKNATEAIDAVPPEQRGEPTIRVRVEPAAEGRVAVDIIDSGKGFPADNRARLLEPYMTEREGGTGLGLAIVAKILEEHGGGIELKDSPYGRGAWVRLLLPGVNNAEHVADRMASA
jgi:two-component system nitrogen regulation sensor histidine kinase NtrY